MPFIKKLKILFNCNWFLIFLFCMALLYVFLRNFVWIKELPSLNETVFEGIVTDYEKSTDKLTLYLKGDYSIIAQYYDDFSIAYGDKVRIKGEYKEIANETIPYAFSYKDYLKNKDIAGVFTIEKMEKLEEGNFFYSIKNWVRKRIDSVDEKGYLLAFILGDKRSIEDAMYDHFSEIGVTHLFALSGMHVGVLSGIFLLLFKKFPRGKYWLTSCFLLFYGLLVCFPSSLKRCILFLILNVFNKAFSFCLSPIKILLYVLVILLFLNYKIIFDVGFLFSFATVFGILLFSEKKETNRFWSALKISGVAFLFSLPITLSVYYSVNFFSILYNLFYIPFVSLLLYPVALLTFLFPFLYPVFSFLVSILEHITLFLSKIDFLTLYLSFQGGFILFYYFFLLLFYKTKKKIFFLLTCSLLFLKLFLPYFDANGYIYFFDVGQGDSCLILSPYRKDVILIDTGGVTTFKGEPYYVSDGIISFLKHEGIKNIDYLILSHGDYDHMGDATNLVNNIKVDKVVLNCGPYNDLENELIKLLDTKRIEYHSCINELNINNTKLHFLNTKEYDNENDNSNVIYAKLYNYKFLFMGDASNVTEKEILSKYNLSNIDILKVGHHGSKTSSSKEFIGTIKPKYSIISVGKSNRYGHPNKEVLETLSNSKIYRTDLDGSIEIKLNKNGYKIKNYSP